MITDERIQEIAYKAMGNLYRRMEEYAKNTGTPHNTLPFDVGVPLVIEAIKNAINENAYQQFISMSLVSEKDIVSTFDPATGQPRIPDSHEIYMSDVK